MNTNNTTDPVDDDSTGVLDEAIAIDTTAIGIIGSPATAQVSVVLPMSVDDDLADDEVIDGEVDESVVADLTDSGTRGIASPAEATAGTRPDEEPPTTGAITISSLPAAPARGEEQPADEELTDAEPVDPALTDAEPADAAPADAAPADAELMDTEPADPEPADAELPDAALTDTELPEAVEPDAELMDAEHADAEPADAEPSDAEPAHVDALDAELVDAELVDVEPVDAELADAEPADAELADAEPADAELVDAEPVDAEPVDAEPVDVEPADVPSTDVESADLHALDAESTDGAPVDVESAHPQTLSATDDESEPVGVADPPADNVEEPGVEAPAPSLVRPTTRRAAAHPEAKEASRMEEPKRAVTRHAARSTEPNPTPAAKRVGDLSESSRESADLLTSDRLLVPSRAARPEPEGGWSHLVYSLTGGRINLGDGRRARERKALSARIAAPLTGGARFVPVLSRKGGVGKTTITALLGMALADARDDRVIAIDANPDRGTLADRIAHTGRTSSVRDLVKARDRISGYHDVSALVARDSTRLDVLASDDDPRVAEAFGDPAYREVADVAAHFYSLVLTDTGTGIVHDVMSATLDLADRLVIVSGLSVDEARLASETLTWLETNGHARQVREAIVVLNQSAPGTPLVRVDELQTHFATRVRSVLRMPYDAQIAAGGPIVFAQLQPTTRAAARELAALVVEGLRTEASA
ncbi:MinD/ParA family protein [uncultured Microbacterium sp.]|uniref:nucleotide-binding protein n=1 Tax=uncultured Microbacterium sp. TaxID=191216 RepID=UPI0028DCAB03|nr:MinD/ParA family protein [uncultured Microbacterium sp.]